MPPLSLQIVPLGFRSFHFFIISSYFLQASPISSTFVRFHISLFQPSVVNSPSLNQKPFFDDRRTDETTQVLPFTPKVTMEQNELIIILMYKYTYFLLTSIRRSSMMKKIIRTREE